MKFSNLSNINRRAIAGAVTQDAFALAHERAANEVIDQKFEFDEVDSRDVNAWLAEQIKDADLQEAEFFASAEEQKELHYEDLKRITEALDKKTQEQLKELQKTQQQRQEAIAKHVQQQKENLAKAIQEKKEADQRLAESKAALAELAQQHRTLMQEHIATAQAVFEKQQQLKASEPVAAQAMSRVQDHYRAQAKDPFDYKGSVFDHPGKHALDRDRAFQRKMETMGDSARQARDPDVRERIELEIQRQRGQYGAAQNTKIAQLTGSPRDGAIDTYEKMEQAATLRAAELDKQLEARGIKVDFSQGAAPDIRAIQAHEKLPENVKADIETVNAHSMLKKEEQVAKDREETVRNQLNAHDRTLSTAESATQTAATESSAKARLLANIQRAELENKPLPPQTNDLVAAARKRNEEMERNRELQQQQQQQQKSASLGMR